MTLYRAVYQTRSNHQRKMSYAAQDLRDAARIAKDWQLADDTLVAVRPVRRLSEQFKLGGAQWN